MAMLRRPKGNERGKNTVRTGRNASLPLLISTGRCSKKEKNALYNENEDVLILAGLDPERMEYLPAAERIRLLKDAGLDPREFDF